MAIRRWVVHPRVGEAEVDREDVAAGLLDGESILARCGGVLTVVTRREPTELDGVMYTSGVAFEWKDRTDARPAAERHGRADMTEAPAPVSGFYAPEPFYAEPAEEERDMLDEQPLVEYAGGLPPEPEAAVVEPLAEEDESSIPEPLRSR